MRVVYEDDSLCVIDKVSGVVVNDSQTAKDTIQRWFVNKYNIGGEGEFGQKQGIVHRLDKDTSGVMVMAKTSGAYEFLKQQFMERKVLKKYVTLVHGKLESEGTISVPIERNPVNKFKFCVGTDLSRMAISDWKVVKIFKDFTLVEVTPHTGRTHQIRVHMKHLGHPVVSDPIYGGKGFKNDLRLCPRLFLHAKYLEFTHPDSGSRVVYESELPNELAQVLVKLVD